MITKTLIIKNKLGLHTRAAAKLVKTAAKYISKISITNTKGEKVAAKSIMGVMLLAATKGTNLEFTIDGPDEEEAMTALETLFNAKFGEE